MSKYIIHACPERMWYVERFLAPSLRAQGIEPIIWNDSQRLGNLDSCMHCFRDIEGDAWHLQDDVIICRDFAKRTQEHDSGIVCGYCWENGVRKVPGVVKVTEMWWSFPCIRIPGQYAKECAEWFYSTQHHVLWRAEKKYDDSFFKEFIETFYPTIDILNLRPTLVDHIDFLIGGTIVNKLRPEKETRAKWFDDIDLVEELRRKLHG